MINNKKLQKDEDEEFDFSKMVSNFLGYWKLIVVCVLISLVAAFLFLRYSTPQYKIHAKLLVEDQQSSSASIFSSSAISSTFGDLFDMESSVDNEAEILKTRDLMEKVVQALNLNVTYFQQGQLHAVELYNRSPFNLQVLSFNDSLSTSPFIVRFENNNTFTIKNDDLNLDIKAHSGDTIRAAGGNFVVMRTDAPVDIDEKYSVTISSIDGTVANYRQSLTVSLTGDKISTIDLLLDSNIPTKGEEVVSTLIKEYLNGNLQEKNKFADSTIAFIDARLQIVNSELSNIENDVQAFKQDNSIANLQVQSSLILNNSSDYYNQLNDIEVKLEIANTMLNYLNDNKNNGRPIPALSGTPDPSFAGLVQRYNTLQAQKDRLALNSTDENPYIQNVTEQLQTVRRDLNNNLQNQIKNLQIVRQKLVAENSTIAGTIKRVPAQERQFLDLSRQQDIKQALFLYLLQKREEVEVSKASNIAGARVIDHPKSEVKPFFPNRILIMGGGLMFGLIAPIGFIILRNLLNTKIETKADIEANTKVPIIGEISHNATDDTVVVSAESRTPISEQFRAVRTNLQFYLDAEKDEKVILLTSSTSGEGKSFTAINLGMVLAISGKKVVMMELDLRKPNLSVKLPAVNASVGFTNYIVGSSLQPEDIVKPTGINNNLFLVGAGTLPPNPSEILLSKKVGVLIAELKKDFDFVIIDAPPVGVVTDAQLLAPMADLCIYLVRQNFTQKQQLETAQDLYENDKMKKIALLVNDIEVKKGYGYGYGYGYGLYGEYGAKKK